MSRLRPLVAPDRPPRRYSGRPLPRYRHVPGLTPHPVRDPEGHAHGIRESPPAAGCRGLPESWRDCEEYLLGVDLFNRAFFWEAHEAWEAVWHAVGAKSPPGLFAQGLIQSSAALLKLHLEVPRGARLLAEKASARFDEALGGTSGAIGGEPSYMGLRVAPWRVVFERYLMGASDRFPFLQLTL